MSFQVRIKTPSDETIPIDVSTSTTVDDLRSAVLNKISSLSSGNGGSSSVVGKTVKLISSGKLLAPPAAKIVSFGISEGTFIHAVLGKAPAASAVLHELDTDIHDIEAGLSSPLVARRGLERLRPIYGFSSEEILVVRRGFSDSINAYAENHPRREDEDDETHRNRIEEEWMLTQENLFEFQMNLRRVVPDRDRFGTGLEESYVGSFRDLMYGFALGSILGVFMLVGIWNSEISYRQKLGILLGVFTNLLLSSNFSTARA